MKGTKRWKFSGGLIISTLVIAAVWMLWPAPEPVYQGKPLRYWLAQTRLPLYAQDRDPDLAFALKHIGTNAIPTLLHLVAAKDAGLTEKVDLVLERLPWVDWRIETAYDKLQLALGGFELLGPVGRDAVPELMRIYERQPHSVYSRGVVAEIFGCIGTAAGPAVPLLVSALATDTDVGERSAAASALGSIQSRPEISIPALLAALGDPSELVSTRSARALGSFDSQPDIIIPALISVLRDRSSMVKTAAAFSLGKLHARPEIAITALIAGLDDSDVQVRANAALALGAFGPAARGALPTLRSFLLQGANVPDSGGSLLYRCAKKALAKISPSNSELCDFPN